MGISLKIKGNKRTNEGIGNDLVSLGDNRFPVIDAQYPGAGATDFIVVRHLPDKSIYTIVSKNVVPCDSNREGTLYISVAIPANEHVSGLFNLLIELQNAYKGNCMAFDGARYQFMAREENPQIFAEIISRHKVTKYPYKRIATSDDLASIAYLFMTPEQISNILDDPMRGEFASFGQIVLVPVADTSQYASTINIPDKIWRSYKIYVNGRQTGQTLADPNKTVTITLPATATHEPASATFSISKARETRMPGIAVDDVAQIIYINLQPKLKPVRKPTIDDAIVRMEKQRTKRTRLIVAVCAVIVIAVGAFLLFFSSGDDTKGKNPNTSKTTNTGGQGNNGGTINEEGGEVVNWGEGGEGGDSGSGSEGGSDEGDGSSSGDDSTGSTGDGGNVGNGGSGNNVNDRGTNTGNNPPKNEPTVEDKFKEDYNKINNPENLSFKTINNLYKNRTNSYDNSIKGYDDYKAKVEFLHELVQYIQKKEKNQVSDYNAQIENFIDKAKKFKMNGLVKKLEQRNPDDLDKKKEKMKIIDRF